MVKLSIIVPIYGVEQYLRKCVDSLLNQDMDNYEIILVDDGSTDRSGAICDSYVSIDDRCINNRCTIKVIHRENGGLSAARNSGIEVAQGEYVMFVDSDDYIETDVLGGLIEQVERDNLDVLRYRLQYVRQVDATHLDAKRLDSSNLDAAHLEYQVFNPYKKDPFRGNDYSEVPTDGVTFLNERMNTQCYAWQFVLKREILDGCMFTPGIYFEDTDWTPRMLVKAMRVASSETVAYNYLMREGSITNAVNRSKQKKVLDDKMHLIATLQQQAVDMCKAGRYNSWYMDMISDLVVSIITMLGVDFYGVKDTYLNQLQQMQVYPLQPKSLNVRLINLSPKFMVNLIHLKNKK